MNRYDYFLDENRNLRCPECGSDSITERAHDDGLGYVDVEVVCQDCNESTWK